MLVNMARASGLDSFYGSAAQASAPVALQAGQPILLEGAHCTSSTTGFMQASIIAVCTYLPPGRQRNTSN